MTMDYPEAVNQLARLIVASANLRMGIDCYRLSVSEWERKVLTLDLPADLQQDLEIFRAVRQAADDQGGSQIHYDAAVDAAVAWPTDTQKPMEHLVMMIPANSGSPEAKRAYAAALQFDAVCQQLNRGLIGGAEGRDLDPRRELMDRWRNEAAITLRTTINGRTRTVDGTLKVAAMLGVDLPQLPQQALTATG